MAAVQNIYGVTAHPQEEHQEEIENSNNIVQGMHTSSSELEGMAQDIASLTSSSSVLMSQLSQMTVKSNSIQAQINTLSLTTLNPTSNRRKFYC